MVVRELAYALRQLRKAPGFAVVAILTLALGIGASTAVFTAVDSIVLKPLRFRDSGQLVVAWEGVRFLSSEPGGPNPRHADLWQKRATAFSGLTLLQEGRRGVAFGNEHPQLVGSVRALPNLFDILQVTPLLGRTFRPEEGTKGRDNVTVVTYGLWQSMFHRDPNVVGRIIRVAEAPYQIIGVLPAAFQFPNANALRAFRSKQQASSVPEPELFLPAAIDLNDFGWNGDYGNWVALGRLKPGVTVKQAEAQLNTIQRQVEQLIPANEGGGKTGVLSASVQPMQVAVVGESKTRLWLLMAAVGGLMLIACVNLANAQLARAISRQREAATRRALGASPWQLMWSSLAESALLALVGGAAGVLLALQGVALFRRYSPIDLPRMAELHVNLAVLLFALVLTTGASVLFGIMPALSFLRVDPQSALQQSSARAAGSQQGRLVRKSLIAVEVFGCTALLLVTGLFAKSLIGLLHVDKGFAADHVIVAEVDLSRKNFDPAQSRTVFDDAVLADLRTISGVRSAGLVSAMPLEGETWIDELRRADRPGQDGPLLNLRWVSPEYFETMGEKLVAGRFFEERDRNLNSVVISESEAKALFPGANAVGAQLKKEDRIYTVIGVVADSRNTSLKSAPPRMGYLHYKDNPPYATFFAVRSVQAPEALAARVRQTIWKRAPETTIARVKTLDAQVRDSLASDRFETDMLATFGGAALLLAMLGIYGVLSYSVAGRRQEIGVRMALGATPPQIYSLTLGEAAAPVIAGLAGGVVASVMAANAVEKLLYGIKGLDPAVAIITAGLFLIAALAAAFLPARRAASIDPMQALRAE